MTEQQPASPMIPAPLAAEQIKSAGLGFERVELIHGSTYTDTSTVVLIPTRGMLHHRFMSSLMGMMAPMNQKRHVQPVVPPASALQMVSGDEVGKAYDRMIKGVLADPELSKWKYIMTIEDDNLVPPDAHIRLLESIELGKFDAVSGIYFTKGDFNMPMAYGDPDEYARTGVIDFKPRDVREGLKSGYIMPVNGIAMGCGLWRMDLFRQMEPPWFVTVADIIPEKGPMLYTQDLFFCQNAKKAGKRFAVDLRVRVGHLDVATGIVY